MIRKLNRFCHSHTVFTVLRLVALLALFSCHGSNKDDSGIDRTTIGVVTANGQISIRESYLPLIKELAEIECAYLKRAGNSVADSSVYSIHSLAFQEVLKDLDRNVLAHYEDIYQLLARYEYLMSPEERRQYEMDIQEVYSAYCGKK